MQVEPEWAVDGVSRETIEHVWDDAWPYLERAIKRVPPAQPVTEFEVYRSIAKGERQLWIGWSFKDEKVVGAVLTETFEDKTMPGQLLLGIPLVGADHWMKWGDTMWTLLKSWGRSKGCSYFIGYGGRKGWARLYGFTLLGKTETGTPVYIRKL